MTVERKGDISILVDDKNLSRIASNIIVWSPNKGVIDTCSIDRAVEISIEKGLYRCGLSADGNSQAKILYLRL